MRSPANVQSSQPKAQTPNPTGKLVLIGPNTKARLALESLAFAEVWSACGSCWLCMLGTGHAQEQSIAAIHVAVPQEHSFAMALRR